MLLLTCPKDGPIAREVRLEPSKVPETPPWRAAQAHPDERDLAKPPCSQKRSNSVEHRLKLERRYLTPISIYLASAIAYEIRKYLFPERFSDELRPFHD